MLIRDHLLQENFVDGTTAVKTAHHRSPRGRVEVISHDCWNHNVLFDASKKTLLYSLVGNILMDAKMRKSGHRVAILSAVFGAGSPRHVEQPARKETPQP